jgi:hypothetical protein
MSGMAAAIRMIGRAEAARTEGAARKPVRRLFVPLSLGRRAPKRTEETDERDEKQDRTHRGRSPVHHRPPLVVREPTLAPSARPGDPAIKAPAGSSLERWT